MLPLPHLPVPTRLLPVSQPVGQPVSQPVSLRAGALAEHAGVHPETLRYYERRGLLEVPDRSPGGHRLYPESAVTRLRVIKAAQRLGFTLDEVTDLLRLGRRRGRDAGLQARAVAKLAEIEQRMSDLAVVRDNLHAAIDAGCEDLHACVGHDCCPIPFDGLAARTAVDASGVASDPRSGAAPRAGAASTP